jgi:uncharacterized protein (TIGR02646 family)
MIFVQRTDEPQIMIRSGAQWLADLRTALAALERLEGDPSATASQVKSARDKVTKAQNKYRHPQVKDALVRMFKGKCAYCESLVTVVTYGQIEHFYPKAQYVDRTFRWDNLLLSCDVCNNAQHKGTKFPLDESGNPLLINPTISKPEIHLLFTWDPVAGLAAVYGRDPRGTETVKTFDLNGLTGRKELIKNRSNHVRRLMALVPFVTQGIDEARSILLDACRAEEPYAAFVQALVEPVLDRS